MGSAPLKVSVAVVVVVSAFYSIIDLMSGIVRAAALVGEAMQ